MKISANGRKINSLKWDIEDECNLSCKHCMLSGVKYESTSSILENKMNLKRLIDLGLKQILFMSREPFLYKGIEELVDYAHSKGIVTGIITNGTLVTYQKIEKLLLVGLDYLIISLEGVCPETNDYIRGEGVFEKIEAGLKTIQQVFDDYGESFRLVLEYTINQRNLFESKKLIDYLNTHMFEIVNIGAINPVGEANLHVEIIPKEEDVNQFIKDLMVEYKKNRNNKYTIFPKSLYPYEIVYMNTYYQTDLTFMTLGCSIFSGEYTLGTDGVLKMCSLLQNNQSKEKTVVGKIATMTDRQIKKHINETQNVCNHLLYNCKDICLECTFVKKCFACPAVTDQLQKDTYEKCYSFRKKFYNSIEESMYSGKWGCSFAEGVTLEEVDENIVKISRHYINNSINEILVHKGHWISIFSKTFILKISSFEKNGLRKDDFINMAMNDMIILIRKG